MKKLLIILIVNAYCFSAHALYINKRKYHRQLVSEIEKIDNALLGADKMYPNAVNKPDHLWFRLQVHKPLLRLWFLRMTITPEIELHWKKKPSKITRR